MAICNLVPICFTCARFKGVAPDKGFVCDAYPNSIPVDILASAIDHHKPYDDDNGLQYKAKGSEDMVIATDPPVSEAQRKAMWAAKSGHSTLGIPQSVGKEFAEADPGGKLPAKAKDMTGGDWRDLFRTMFKFLKEESQEPEHKETIANSTEKANIEPGEENQEDRLGGSVRDAELASRELSKTTRKEIGTPGSEHREEMPEGAFLGPNKTYPVKEERDGKWEYTQKLLKAAASRARMQGRNDIARRADAIRAREFGGEKSKDMWTGKSEPINTLNFRREAANGEGNTGGANAKVIKDWHSDDEWTDAARKAAAEARARKSHLHMTASHESGSKPSFRTQASNHNEVEGHLNNLHQHIKKNNLGTHNVHIENKHTGEVHHAKVAPHGIFGRTFKKGSFDTLGNKLDSPHAAYPESKDYPLKDKAFDWLPGQLKEAELRAAKAVKQAIAYDSMFGEGLDLAD